MIYLCGATVARRSRVWSDHVRIMGGSVPHCKWGFTCVSCICGRQNSIVICNCRVVPAMQMGSQVVVVDELPMEFHCDLQLKDRSLTVNGIASGVGGGVADGVLKEVSHEMRFWEIADARNPMFFHTKSVPEPRWSTSAVRRLRDGLVCGRIMFGSWADRFRIVNGVSPVFRAFAVDRIPLWFVTVGSFLQCKWDCKWCWWMSCRWNSIVICNSRIVPAMQFWSYNFRRRCA